ncbi:MAG TPA: GntR family transcriptional regulator [Chthonomonadaceae bacterium]|nr:GntR family transcriptional regulator [Chthonomonadaceae bacterium]
MRQTITPTVSRIASTLQERIHSSQYAEGQWFPTERELAEEFAVSRATIRLALIELEKRNLVVRAAGCRPIVRGGFGGIPNGSGQARQSLALWISGDPTDLGGAMTVRGIHNVLDPDVYRLVVANHCGDTLEALIAAEAQALERFARDNDIAGLILWYFGGQQNLPALERLRAARIPMVFVDRRPPPGFEADYVGVYNARAAQEAVQHLIQQGHRKIGHVTNSESASTVAERLEGYKRALAAANLPFREEWVLTAPFLEAEGAGLSTRAAAVADRLVALPDPPTAVFVVNDSTAVRLVMELRARGVRVPEELAVVGFDDEERWMPGKPFLTTIRQPFEAMGEEAARLLLERLKTGSVSAYRHILLDAPLVVRESTAPPMRQEAP